MENQTNRYLQKNLRPLQFALAAIALLGGIDKYFNLLSYWPQYVPKLLAEILPVSPQMYMYSVGVGEIIICVFLIFKPQIGGWLSALMFGVIIAHLVALPGYYNIIMLDSGLGLASITPALLSTKPK